jgi:hypothetical protein
MKRSRRYRIAVPLVMLAVALPLHAESLRYEVKIDLGVGIYAAKLNNVDEILGKRQGTPGVWSPGTGFAALPAPVGATSGFAAVDFNDKGEVIGTTFNVYGNPDRGLFWTSLKTAPTTITEGLPVAINAKGHIALSYQASIWSNGKAIPLPKYRDATVSPADINDADTVAATGGSGVVLISQGVAHEIPNLPIFSDFYGNPGLYLNSAGTVAANSLRYTNSRRISRAVILTPESGTIDLGTRANQSSFVVGIDDHNRVLGYVDRDGGTPFVWALGMGMTELTSLVNLSDQYLRMQSVADINSRGDILGSLLDRDGRSHIVVLMPIPEPAVWLIVAVGMLGMLFKSRRTRMHVLVAQRRGNANAGSGPRWRVSK